ncbi:MAG TPA: high-affinity nickel-transport family protein [Methylomirabilota bacterium]
MDTGVSAILLGFVLGVQHATDPDHLVAVATIVTRERRFRDGAGIGALWGLGHMLTLTIAGALVLALGARPGPRVSTGLELVVAAMLVVLGIVRLREASRGIDSVEPSHLAADHDHVGAEALHSHAHLHGVHVHAHPHLHPSRRLLAALGAGRRWLAARAVLVGAVHGMAGTAAVSLLVLTTLPSVMSGFLYLLVFGIGTLLGMTAMTAAMAYPVAVAARGRRWRRGLAVGAGLGSVVFGLLYAARLAG